MGAHDAVVAAGLTKDYGAGRGVFDLDLVVPRGEVFGFLGPNGAGKTTTIRLLMGSIRPTRGGAQIFGLDCQDQAVAVKRHVGFLPGELPQFGGLRGSEIVGYIAGLRGDVDDAHVTALATRLGLDLGRRYREYSRGNKQKLGLVLAFMHRPALLILDEPTGGLDPLNQQTFYDLVREARGGGATVFLSSHVLSEVEHICDRIGIVRDGRLVYSGHLGNVHALRGRRVELVFQGQAPEAALRAAAGVSQLAIEGNRAQCAVIGTFDGLLAALATSGAQVISLTSEEPSLEELFLTYFHSEDRR